LETVPLQEIADNIRSAALKIQKIEEFAQYSAKLEKIAAETRAPLLVMVMGEFSTGKSTFINALMGQEVTVVNDTPTTAVITKLCYGNTNRIEIYFNDGHRELHELQDLSVITAESGKEHEDMHREIDHVEVAMPIPFLKEINIIDSPGLNADKKAHMEATKKYMDKADSTFWMFSADATGKQTELQAIKELSPRLKPIAIVNKIDEIDEEEESIDEVLHAIRGILKNSVSRVIGVSARWALQGKLEGKDDLLISSNFAAVDAILQSQASTGQRNVYKMNSLLEAMADILMHIGKDCDGKLMLMESERNKDYDNYIRIKAAVSSIQQIISHTVGLFIKQVMDLCTTENFPAQIFCDVALYYGYGITQNKAQAVNLLESLPETGNNLNEYILYEYYDHTDENEKKFYWVRRLARHGDIKAMQVLGNAFLNGIGVQKNAAEAVKWYRKAAEQGDAEAQDHLGTCYRKGIGVQQDAGEAVKWYRKAAEQGNAAAQNVLGYCCDGGEGTQQDVTEAAKWYRKAAEQGYAVAQTNLGTCYRKGEGVQQDAAEAVKWYRKAAEQGEATAQTNLGNCYRMGTGVPMDSVEAVKWYRKAAEQGEAIAQINLGSCYEKGIGVQPYAVEAVKWYRKAAEQGNAKAQTSLGECYGKGAGVQKDLVEATSWYRKAAEQGDATAQEHLGNRYCMGIGAQKDLAEAVKWYRKAAEQGNAAAQTSLGYCYHKGEGVQKNIAEAAKWYRKAAEQGEATAQTNLGYCYDGGEGVQQDAVEAVKWYRKAAEQGSVEAQTNLGSCYEKGIGVQADAVEAVKWYRKAADQGSTEAQKRLGNQYYILGNQHYRDYMAIGVQEDAGEAVKWYRKAADQGDAAAQNNLGVCYAQGTGIQQDAVEAVKWYRKAAEQGNANAQNNIGSCYYNGTGVQEDAGEAVTWYRKAAYQGDEAAQNNLNIYRQKSKRRNKIIVIGMVIFGFAAIIGMVMNYTQQEKIILPGINKVVKTETQINNDPTQKNLLTKKQMTQNALKNYINLKNQYDNEITSLADDVNAYVAKYDGFSTDEGLIARAQGLESRIIATKNDVSRATIPNQTVKFKLIEVLGLEATRAHGLYVGMRASQHGGSYSPGFKSGTAAAYKFDDANAELTKLLQ
jgi:TPR repeat protein/predicted GTPase